MTPRLLLTSGDPAGIGPEVLLKTLSLGARSQTWHPLVSTTVVGDISFLQALACRLRIPVPWGRFHWIDLPMVGRVVPGRPQPEAGRAAFSFLKAAVAEIRAGRADVLVTAPVSKEAIASAGVRWIGHTEYLAEQFHCRTTMMLVSGSFRVSLLTTHCSIRQISRFLRRSDLIRVIRQTRESLVLDFRIRRPRIGVAALNPHGGEGGLFGAEEKEILRPAVRAAGAGVLGPFPSDSLMKEACDGAFDAVVAVYHDQALIPVKLIGWRQAVNVTLGLPFVRTSPVHGTAFDIAGRGKADPSSMKAAIRLAITLGRRHVVRRSRA